jgi:hypothetical protein
VAFLLAAGLIAGTGQVILDGVLKLEIRRQMPWAPVFGMAGMVGGVLFAIWSRRRLLQRSSSRLSEPYLRAIGLQADVLVNVFPEAVQAWGGRKVLLQWLPVERIAQELEARASVTPADRHRTFRVDRAALEPTPRPDHPQQKTLPATQTAPAHLGAEMLRELVRHYVEGHAAVEAARKTPKKIATAAAVIGYYTFGILGGLTIALPVLFVVFNGTVTDRAIFIPLIAIAGTALSVWVAFLVCRWFLRYQLRLRTQQPLSELGKRVDFLLRAFPEATEEWGGREALMRQDAAADMAARLERLL